jgi:putative flippase GtrA
VLKINFLISNSISFICAVLISFFFNKYITFEFSDNNSIVNHISKFFIISIISLGISNSLIFLFITYFSLIPLYAKLLQICITYPINYFLIKKFVFRFE